MARWKARVDFLLTVIELLFYLLPLRRYKAKRVKLTAFRREWASLSEDFRGRGSFVRSVRAGAQSTLDSSAQAVNRPSALAPGREEGNWLVCAVCAPRAGEAG